MTMKKRVAVLFGGSSAEHEISVITALQAMDALDTTRYELLPVYLTPKGQWYTGDALLERTSYRQWEVVKQECTRLMLLPEPETQGFVRYGAHPGDAAALFPVDICVLCFHGQQGEDGCVQGLLELACLPYTSCGVLTSALSMHKAHCKAVMAQHGIAVLPWRLIDHESAKANFQQVLQDAQSVDQFPLFVKPCHLGSSIGVSRVENTSELAHGLSNVFQYDRYAMVEPCISDPLEINISVMETADGLRASPCEIPVASAEVLTFEDKYLRGGKAKGGVQDQGMAGLTRVVDPTDLDPAIKSQVRDWALEAYRLLDAKGVVRFDFMYDTASEQLYFNELNPQPGSLSFYLWEKAKPRLLYTELLDHMIEAALTRESLSIGRRVHLDWQAI